jgi:hypothetical protein
MMQRLHQINKDKKFLFVQDDCDPQAIFVMHLTDIDNQCRVSGYYDTKNPSPPMRFDQRSCWPIGALEALRGICTFRKLLAQALLESENSFIELSNLIEKAPEVSDA